VRIVSPHAHLSFPDMETLLSGLIPERFALLRPLRQTGPCSVRTAARRDYNAVPSDVSALIRKGLTARQAANRVEVLLGSVGAEFRLAA
jgi:predicted transcriptional regulator